MTLEQMDSVVQDYCALIGETSEELCDNCRIKHLCEPIMGDFDRYPDKLEKAYEILANEDEDHNCNNCKFTKCGIEEDPCDKCKYTRVASDPAYATTPLLWTPQTPKLPIIETVLPIIETVPASNFNNPVNHPSHYNQGGIECIDAMIAAFGKEATATFCHLNAFKYLWRSEHKNGVEDIDKAIWYLTKYKELKTSGE
jgi:hypothetical protein